MNVNIIESNGMNTSVTLICYFTGNNGKNYLFYTKNETVQDGLIKMYVACETGTISDVEWTDLKKDMQQIIMRNSTVKFLNYSNPVKIGEARAIALNNTNIDAIKKAYSKNTEVSIGTNKDLLSQSFNETPEIQTQVQQPQSEPVQISSIPNIQNNFNMEGNPVNLNTSSEHVVPNVEPINPVSTPNIPNGDENGPALNINSVKPSGIDSGFKVSNEPNIFDQPSTPFNITEEDVNKPLDAPIQNNNNNVFNGNSDVGNIFNTPVVEPINDRVNNGNNNTNSSSVINNNVDVSKQIELNEKKIKLFTELANVYKEENDMLKSNVSDNTASNLFNNNGTLDDLKILQG